MRIKPSPGTAQRNMGASKGSRAKPKPMRKVAKKPARRKNRRSGGTKGGY